MQNKQLTPTDNTISNKWIDPADFHSVRVGGLTKRELIAAMCFAEMIAANWTDYVTAAKTSVRAAEELLKQLSNGSNS